MKRRKRVNDEEAAAFTSPSAAAGYLLILEGEDKAAAGRKQRKRGKDNQEQSSKPPLLLDVHPQGVGGEGGKLAADGPGGKKSVKRSISKKPRVPSTREFIRMRLELRKEQPLPPGILPATEITAKPSPHHSSPFGAFFDQFCYKPDRPARPLPRAHPSSESSQLTANQTSKAVKATQTSVKRTRLASATGSQVKVTAKGKQGPEKKPPRKKAPPLSAAEKRSDKYRRLPPDQLVPPPRSPHKLLQEKYASDPWKVIVICMLLNLTQGKQVRKKVKGFFKRYPDAQVAYNADPKRMAAYLAPLGLQHVKTKRIQKLSKAYVEEEWSSITELCGVGKYAADAYAIFCAGKATEVVPEDHKLVDYWKYVCFELPVIQESQSLQEAGMTGLEKVAPEQLQELAASC